MWLLGAYGIAGHKSLLTMNSGDGANANLRNCHKKRAIMWTEPDKVTQFKVSSIKELSGDE